MSIPVTLAGVTYQVPETGETGWGDETTNYLVALSNSISKTDVKFRTRQAIASPVTATATDVVILCNIPSASTVNLPAGITDRIYIVADASGAAQTNNITVNTSGGQLINGSTSYVIRENYGFVYLIFDGTRWNVIAEGKTPVRSPVYRLNESANASFVDSSVSRQSTPATAANGQSCSATFDGSEGMTFQISLSTGESLLCQTDESSGVVSCLSDHANLFLLADAGTGIYVSKSSSSKTITIKNRMGSPAIIEIKSLTNRFSSVTAWS